jgi:ferredoxin-nitrate reductase
MPPVANSDAASAREARPGPARAQCPYCGVGCGLELKPGDPATGPETGPASWSVRGDRQHPSSLGQVCIKGATVAETLDHNRLVQPQWRERLDQPFRPIDWEQAFAILINQIQHTLASSGPSGLAMYGSGQFLTEDYYVANKLFKGALGSNNFDANSRLCMSSAVSGYARSLGSDGPPCCYDDLDLADLVVLIGTNTADCHPVLFQRLLKRKRKAKEALQIVVVDPRATATSDAADLHLAIRPGTIAPSWISTRKDLRPWTRFGRPGRRSGSASCVALRSPNWSSWPSSGRAARPCSASGRWG